VLIRIIIALLFASPLLAADLQQQLESVAARHHGKVAIWAHDLRTGRTAAIHARTPVQTASVIKVPIMIEAYRQASEGKLNLEQRIPLTTENITGGSGVFQFMRPGLEPTIRDVIAMMITQSDNTATNMMIDLLGTKAINSRLQAQGFKSTWLYKKIGKPATAPMPVDQKQFGLGKTTAEEMGRILESVATCEIKEPELCEEMIHLMQNQSYRGMIPRYLETFDPTESPSAIAGKIGMLDDVRNDVSLVSTKCGKIVISAFTWANADQRWTPDVQSEILIGKMAKMIVNAWCPAQPHKH
jgi:beta-lactamase class A